VSNLSCARHVGVAVGARGSHGPVRRDRRRRRVVCSVGCCTIATFAPMLGVSSSVRVDPDRAGVLRSTGGDAGRSRVQGLCPFLDKRPDVVQRCRGWILRLAGMAASPVWSGNQHDADLAIVESELDQLLAVVWDGYGDAWRLEL